MLPARTGRCVVRRRAWLSLRTRGDARDLDLSWCSRCERHAASACNRVSVRIVKCRSHRLSVRAVGTTRTVAEPLEDRVVRDVGHVAQAPAADDDQPDQHPYHRDHPKVAPARQVGEGVTDQAIEVARAQVAPEQLQPGIRRQADVTEFQGQILTRACKSAFLRLTVSGRSCVEERFGSRPLSTTLEGLFQSQSDALGLIKALLQFMWVRNWLKGLQEAQ